VIGFFALWEIGVRMGWISAFLVGSPFGIFGTAFTMIASGELLVGHLVHAVRGYPRLCHRHHLRIAARTGAVVFGFRGAAGRALHRRHQQRAEDRAGADRRALVRHRPRSKVALSVSLTAIVALIAAYQAAKDADVDLQSLLISMGADKHQVFFKAVVPSTLPSIIATFRINIGFGLVGAVVGEFISSQRGLGHLIYNASSLYDLNTVWVGLFTLMIMGFVLYYVIDIIERTSLPWKQSNTTHQVQV
jgi:NitT/TauT family transport system permease protein